MKCPLCGRQFREEEGRIACKGCPLARACPLVKCPNCGYDVLKEPKIIRALKAWGKRDHGTRRKS